MSLIESSPSHSPQPTSLTSSPSVYSPVPPQPLRNPPPPATPLSVPPQPFRNPPATPLPVSPQPLRNPPLRVPPHPLMSPSPPASPLPMPPQPPPPLSSSPVCPPVSPQPLHNPLPLSTPPVWTQPLCGPRPLSSAPPTRPRFLNSPASLFPPLPMWNGFVPLPPFPPPLPPPPYPPPPFHNSLCYSHEDGSSEEEEEEEAIQQVSQGLYEVIPETPWPDLHSKEPWPDLHQSPPQNSIHSNFKAMSPFEESVCPLSDPFQFTVRLPKAKTLVTSPLTVPPWKDIKNAPKPSSSDRVGKLISQTVTNKTPDSSAGPVRKALKPPIHFLLQDDSEDEAEDPAYDDNMEDSACDSMVAEGTYSGRMASSFNEGRYDGVCVGLPTEGVLSLAN